jgi:prophage antirepressor-like protein
MRASREEESRMNQLQVFRYEAQEVRTVIVDGEPWFVARDVCEILEHSNPSKAVKDLVDEDDLTTGYPIVDSMGRTQYATIVNESGLYSLILGSRKPQAKAFKRWVTRDVLPSIRKTGSYVQQPQSIEDLIIMQAQSVKELKAKVEQMRVELQVTRHRIDNLDRIDIEGDEQQRLNKLIRKYAHDNGLTFQKAWRDFTDRFNTAYNTNLTLRMENYRQKYGLRELTRPQYLALVGQLQDAIRVADKMLNQPVEV